MSPLFKRSTHYNRHEVSIHIIFDVNVINVLENLIFEQLARKPVQERVIFL